MPSRFARDGSSRQSRRRGGRGVGRMLAAEQQFVGLIDEDETRPDLYRVLVELAQGFGITRKLGAGGGEKCPADFLAHRLGHGGLACARWSVEQQAGRQGSATAFSAIGVLQAGNDPVERIAQFFNQDEVAQWADLL